MAKKGKFDYILLETTGLADPGPIASIFWLDEELGSDLYLDGEKLFQCSDLFLINRIFCKYDITFSFIELLCESE